MLDESAVDEVIEILEKYDLPTKTDIDTSKLLEVMLNDKKRTGDSINLVLPESIGHCVLKKMNVSDLKDVM